jgi:hypothetical protein
MPHNDEQKRIEELQRAERDSERRLAALEESIKELRKSQLDNHKWFVTVIFSLVGLILVFNSHESRAELHDATLDVKSDVKDAIASAM